MILDLLGIISRWGVYLGAIGTAGSVFGALCVWPLRTEPVNRAFIRQGQTAGAIGIVALLVQISLFLYAISGEDLALAFSPAYIGVALNTAVGHSFLIMFTGGLFLLAGRRFRLFWLQIVAAILIVASFGFQGHSVSFGSRPFVMVLLLTHLSLISWWLAIIWPLLQLQGEDRLKIANRFSSFAIYLVPATLATGLGLWYSFTGGKIDIADPYQIRLALKLMAVVGVLSVAALNKVIFTARDQLTWPLRIEFCFALGVTLLTATLVEIAPS